MYSGYIWQVMGDKRRRRSRSRRNKTSVFFLGDWHTFPTLFLFLYTNVPILLTLLMVSLKLDWVAPLVTKLPLITPPLDLFSNPLLKIL